MDDVIGRLIELDKKARKRVAVAKKASVRTVAKLDEKRDELLERDEEIFEKRISELKSSRETMIEAKKKEISASGDAAIERLDAAFEKNRDAWAERIFEIVTQKE